MVKLVTTRCQIPVCAKKKKPQKSALLHSADSRYEVKMVNVFSRLGALHCGHSHC